MRAILLLTTATLIPSLAACSRAPEGGTPEKAEEMTQDKWQDKLTPEQYYVCRQKGTERPFTGKFVHFDKDGTFTCVACGNKLFDSSTKYDSGSGWPSFWEPLDSANVRTETDTSLGMKRIEVLCAKCGSHLGHVFDDGPDPTGQRYCINSVALDFVEREEDEKP